MSHAAMGFIDSMKRTTAGSTAPRIEGAVFMYDRETPPEWTAALRDISAVSDERGWLELVWEPGDPWAPVQRWELYEMIHHSIVHPAEVAELRGPHPRAQGHPCTSTPISSWAMRPDRKYQPCHCEPKLEAWRDGLSLVSLTEWKLFQRTGYVGRPFWIIQGSAGGNKCDFSHDEGLLLEAEGYAPIAPPSGSLPYAPFDQRVVTAITRFNRLWQFKNNLDEYREAMGPGYEKYRKTMDKELRRQLVAHLKDQMADVEPLFIKAADEGELDNIERTEIDYDRLAPQNEECFIEHGKMLHHSNMK